LERPTARKDNKREVIELRNPPKTTNAYQITPNMGVKKTQTNIFT
jgi:hypothetical protein